MSSELIESLSLIAKTKNLGKDVVLSTLEQSLVNAAKRYLSLNKNIEAEIDEETNDIKVFLRVTVVEDFPDVEEELTAEEVAEIDERYMLIEEARDYNEEAEEGDYLEMEIPIENFGRSAIQSAKQILMQRVRDAERDRIYEDYVDRVGSLVTGTVQQVDRGNILINLGKTEAIMPIKEQIRKERYRQGDTIRAYISTVSNNTKGPQVILSRTHPDFLAKLFEVEVPEISDGIVNIKSVSRDPGFRAKIAVWSKDDRIDPVGACVGMKGNRVQAIVRELSNERIDIIHWTDDLNVYIKRALSPANLKEITNTRDGRVVVIVADEDLSQAIGRGGQNVRLASKLVGHELDIYGATEYTQMPPEDKVELLKPKEGVAVHEEGEAVYKPAEVESKFSQLESLFQKPSEGAEPESQ